LVIATGLRRTPPAASVPYALAISSGETPTRSPPIPSAGIPSSGEVIPIECAVAATACGPTSRSSWAKMTLTEAQVAASTDIVPPPGSALLTVQVPPPGMSRVIGEVPS
jgi:hypothetical protein